MISIFTGPAKIIRPGLSTFYLAGKFYIKESSNRYIKNYIRLSFFISDFKKRYKNTRILVTFIDFYRMDTLSMAFEGIFLYFENFEYILLFI
jgi:hypothetical protein